MTNYGIEILRYYDVCIWRKLLKIFNYLDFRKCAYSAKNRLELIRGVTSFSNQNLSVILPSDYEFNDELLKPIIGWIQEQLKNKAAKVNTQKKPSKKKNTKLPITAQTNDSSEINLFDHEKETVHQENNFDPFKRTGFPFGCLYNETKHRYSKYFSDIKDGLNLHCFISFIFIFTVCFAPALCFAGILEDKIDHWFGLNEVLIATSINGILFALLSGQPLMIFGGIWSTWKKLINFIFIAEIIFFMKATGPFLVFEEMLYIVRLF